MKIISREKYNGKIYGYDDCPFCFDIDEENIIWKGKYWYIQHAKFAYLGLENHFLVIPFAHRVMTSELTNQEFGEFKEIEKFMEEKFKGKDYFSFIRQSKSLNHRSVEHLHYHYLPGCISPENVEKILKDNGF